MRAAALSAAPSRRSAILELGRALFDERAHAFLLILGRKQAVENPALEAHALGERRLISAVDALLGGVDGGRAERRDPRGDLERLFDELGGGKYA